MLIASVSFVLFTSSAYAADRFWVGAQNNSGVWEDLSNWSALKSGAGGSSLPGAADVAIFNSSGNTVTIRSVVAVKEFVMQGTGTLMMGTGALSVGTTGIRIGSGTLVGGAGSLTTSGSYTQTGGSVTALQGNLSVSGSLSVTLASQTDTSTFASPGTIILNGNADQTFTLGTGTTTTVTGITVNNEGGTTIDDVIVIVYTAGGLNMSGALTVTLGNFDLGTNNTVLNAEGNVAIADTAQATLNSDANVIANGNVSVGAAGTLLITGATLTLNGTTQTLDTNNTALLNLTIGAASTTTLTTDQGVETTLQINTGGTLALGSYTVALTGATIVNYGTLTESTGKIVLADSNFIISESTYTSQQASFTIGETVYFTLTDRDENIDGTAQDTVAVAVVTNGGDSETITLTESNNTSGIFNGSAVSSYTFGTSNGTIDAGNDRIITATYTDAQDALSSNDTAELVQQATPSVSTGAVRGSSAKSKRLALIRARQAAAAAAAAGGGGDYPSAPVEPAVNVDYRNTKVAPRQVEQDDTDDEPTRLQNRIESQQPQHRAAIGPIREVMSQNLQIRTCKRVFKWFRGNGKMLGRVNRRLAGRFGFTCEE